MDPEEGFVSQANQLLAHSQMKVDSHERECKLYDQNATSPLWESIPLESLDILVSPFGGIPGDPQNPL